MVRWQLDNRFDYRSVSFLSQLLVYHTGSGMTHLLSSEVAQVFQLFLQQPEKSFRLEDIEKHMDVGGDVAALLSVLQRKDMLVQKRA